MDLRSRYRAQIQNTNLRRLARPQIQPAIRDGKNITLGGNPLRAATVFNEALGTGDAVFLAADSGFSQQERRQIRRIETVRPIFVETGEVKVFVRSAALGIFRYYLGGDQRTKKIFEIDTAQFDVHEAYGEAIGPGRNDWLFTIKTESLSTPGSFKIETIYGDGRPSWESTDLRIQWLNYRGNGFWNSGRIDSAAVGFNAPVVRSSSPVGDVKYGTWSGAVGGIFSSTEWNISIPYLDGASSGYLRENASGVAYNVLPANDPRRIFPDGVGGQKTVVKDHSTLWTEIPGADQDISSIGGQLCAGDGPTTTVRQGATRDTEIDLYDQTESSNVYTISLFDGTISQYSGVASRTISQERRITRERALGNNFTVSAICAFEYTPPRYALTRSGGGGGYLRTNGSGDNSTVTAISYPTPIAPNLIKTNFSNTSETWFYYNLNPTTVVSSPVTRTSAEESFRSERVYPSDVVFYSKNLNPLILVNGQEKSVRDFPRIVSGFLTTTCVATENNISVFEAESPSGVYDKDGLALVTEYKLQGDRFVSTESEKKALKLDIPETSRRILSSWYWPA